MGDFAQRLPIGVSQTRSQPRNLWRDAMHRFGRNQLSVIGLGIVLLFGFLGIAAPVVAPYDPMQLKLEASFMEPNREHWLGTDELGRDVWSRMIWGARYDMSLTLVTVALALVMGVAIGAIAAYSGGVFDLAVMRVMDVLLAFPAFALGLALVAFLGPRLSTVVFVLAITRVPRYARLIRGSVLSIQGREYVDAAHSVGTSRAAILGRHILPNSIAPVIIFATLDLGTIITALAGLSFLGVGIQPPTPDWGLMLTSARNNLVVAPWTAIFPGLAISLVVIGFNFMGDGLRDALDPRTQQ